MNDPVLAALAGHPFARGLDAGQVARLATAAAEITVPAGYRFFEEGGPASQFWLILSGRVALDLNVPGRDPITVETLGAGDVIGLSWLFPEPQWQFGAQAVKETRAVAIDAVAVMAMCDADPVLGYRLLRRIVTVATGRLHAARVRLLDLYAPPADASSAR